MTTATNPVRIEFPVLVKGRPHVVVARAVTPDAEAAARLPRPIWAVGLHGATVDWRYWCTRVEGYGDAYDSSAYFAKRGIGMLALDVFTVGESPYDGDAREITWEDLADAHHQVTEQLRARLKDGTLVGGYEPVEDPAILAFGHSNGVPLAVIQQSIFGDFDAIAPMALSVGPFGGFGARVSFEEGGRPPLGADVNIDAHGMVQLPRRKTRFPNHLDDVPQDVVDAKTNLSFPPCSMQMVSGTPAKPYAASVECPVFIAFGEIDTSDDLLAERRYYPKAEDVTVWIQPGMAHYHNFAGTREELWMALSIWARTRAAVAQSRNAAAPVEPERQAVDA
ncbi:MAG: hypothetical protein QOH81_640 [Sphingomonadales bacterium]|jgi:hypothetical protein|nr:hypothetical protein [Sphingomonadales bacterium]